MRQVVISYARPDVCWADWLAWEVSARGIAVSLERADLTSWDDFIDVADGSGVHYLPLISEHYLAGATTDARWWAARGAEVGADLVTPVVIGPGTAAPAEVLDLTEEMDATAASNLLADVLELGPRPDPARTAAFGDGTPAYPNGVPSIWRMWPRRPVEARNPTVTSALFHAFDPDPEGMRCVSVSGPPGSGKSASITEYALMASSRYAACWAIDCMDVRLLQLEVDRLVGDFDAAADSRPRLLVLGGVDRAAGTLRLPAGTWHVIGLREPDGAAGTVAVAVDGAPASGWWDLGDVTAEPIEAAPRLDGLPDAAVSLVRLLGAGAHYPVPRLMLRHGSAGAPDELAERLSSSADSAEILRSLAAAGLIHLSPHAVRLRSAARAVVRHADHGGFAANVAWSAAIRYGMAERSPAEWTPVLVHLGDAVSRTLEDDWSRHDLYSYLMGWTEGRYQAATATHGAVVVGSILGVSRYNEYVMDLITRFGESQDPAISLQSRLNALIAEARVLRGAGDPDAALRTLATAQETALGPPADDDDRLMSVLPAVFFAERAQALADLGDPLAGVAVLDELHRLVLTGIVTGPLGDDSIHRFHAELLAAGGRAERALELLGSRTSMGDPSTTFDMAAIDVLAFCLLRASRFEAAAEAAERAVLAEAALPVTERKVLRPLVVRAEALRQTGRIDDALAAVHDARAQLAGTEHEPLLAQLDLIEAEMWFERHDVDRAVRLLKHAITLARRAGEPNTEGRYRYRAAEMLMHTGRPDEALQVLATAPEVPRVGGHGAAAVTADLATFQAWIELQQHRPQAALTAAEQAVEQVAHRGRVDATFVEAYTVLGQVLMEVGRHDVAAERIRQADRPGDGPNGVGLRDLGLGVILARALRGADRRDEALQVLTLEAMQHGSVLRDPLLLANAQLLRGQLLVESGARTDGLAAIAESVQASSGTEQKLGAAFLRTVVRALLELGEAEAAYPLVLRQVHNAYHHVDAGQSDIAAGLDHLSQARVALGAAATAIVPSRMAVQASRDASEPSTTMAIRLFNFADALIAAGVPGEAIDVAQEVIALDQAAYGADHPEVGSDYLLLSSALAGANQHALSAKARERANEIFALGE